MKVIKFLEDWGRHKLLHFFYMDNGKIVGRFYLEIELDTVTLCGLYVQQKHRKLGLGNTMMKRAVKEGLKYERDFMLRTEPDWKPQWYERFGFEITIAKGDIVIMTYAK
jgi:N-acetylglutamate synthase-like GNAT family acetyltransferase